MSDIWRVREDTDYYAKFDWVVYRGGLYDDDGDSSYETSAGFHHRAAALAWAELMNRENSE